MVYLTCHGRVTTKDGKAAQGVHIAHSCGSVKCLYWISHGDGQYDETDGDGRYKLQFEAGPQGSLHDISWVVAGSGGEVPCRTWRLYALDGQEQILDIELQ